MEPSGTEMSPSQNTPGEELLLDHAWRWFDLHAGQRMNSINYFLISTAFLAAGYVGSLQSENTSVSAAISLLALVFITGFHVIEARTRQLVRIGEDALEEIEHRISVNTPGVKVALISRASSEAQSFSTYGFAIRMLHMSTFVFFLGGLLYSVWDIMC